MLIATTNRPVLDSICLRWLRLTDSNYSSVKRGPVAVPSTSGKERRPELSSKDLRPTNPTRATRRAAHGISMHARAMTKGPHTFLGSAVPERHTSSSCTCFCSGSELNDERSSLPVRPVSDRRQHSNTPVSNRRKGRRRTPPSPLRRGRNC